MWWSIGGGIIIFALGMFIFLKPGLIRHSLGRPSRSDFVQLEVMALNFSE